MLLFFSALPSHAYNWVTNEEKIPGVTLLTTQSADGTTSTSQLAVYTYTLNADGTKNWTTTNINYTGTETDLAKGVDAFEKNLDDNTIVYLYEVNTGMFLNANGHNGTGAGLLDVGAALVFYDRTNLSGNGTREFGYHIYNNFVNGGRNCLGYTVGSHGDGLFFDRGHSDDDVNDDWLFTPATTPSVADQQAGTLQQFYMSSQFNKNGYAGTYYLALKSKDKKEAMNDPHIPFTVVEWEGDITEDFATKNNLAKFIIVTKGMLKAAFKDAATYASVTDPVDASWLMKDEDFIRTHSGHTYNPNVTDAVNNTVWHISPALTNFMPLGGDGASTNRYIGSGETDAFCDYDKYTNVMLPNTYAGYLYQDVSINTRDYPGWYRFSVKGVTMNDNDVLFANIGAAGDTGLPNTTSDNLTNSFQKMRLQEVNFYSSDNLPIPGHEALHYVSQTINTPGGKTDVMAYYTNVKNSTDKYFHHAYEAETASDEAVAAGTGSLATGFSFQGEDNKSYQNSDDNAKGGAVQVARGNTIHFTVNIPDGYAGDYILTAIVDKDGKKDLTVNVTDKDNTVLLNKEIIADNSRGTLLFSANLKEGDNHVSFTSNTTDNFIIDRLVVEKGALVSVVDKPDGTATDYKPAITTDDAGNTVLATTLDEKDPDNDGNIIFNLHHGENIKSSNNTEDRAPSLNTTGKAYPYVGNLGLGTGFPKTLTNKIPDNTYSGNDWNAFTKEVRDKGGDNSIELQLPLEGNGNDDNGPTYYKITLWGYSSGNSSYAYVGFNNKGNTKDGYKHWYNYNTYHENLIAHFTDPNNLQGVSIYQSLYPSQTYMTIGGGKNGWAPDIAYITIQPLSRDGDVQDNGQGYITLAKGESHTFKVNVPDDGDYHVALWYANNKESNVTVNANGTQQTMVLDPSNRSSRDQNGRGVISPYTYLNLNANKDNEVTVTNNSDNSLLLSDLVASPGVPAQFELGRDFQLSARSKASSVVLYLPKTTEATTNVKVGVYKQASTDPVYLDAFRIDYTGDNKGIVLDETQRSWKYVYDPDFTNTEDYVKNSENVDMAQYNRLTNKKNVPVYLVRKFNITGDKNYVKEDKNNPGQWTTICLPFNVTRSSLISAFGNTVKVGTLADCSGSSIVFNIEDFSQQRQEEEDRVVLTKGKPYFIKVAKPATEMTQETINNLQVAHRKDNSDASPMVTGLAHLATDEGYTEGTKYYLLMADFMDKDNNEDFVTDPLTSDQFKEGSYVTKVAGHDGNSESLHFVPMMYNQRLPKGVYILNDGSFGFYNGNYRMNGFRAFIADMADGFEPGDPSASGKANVKPFYFEDTTTGIVEIVESIDANDTKNLSPTDNKVYNLSGQQVQANELQRGVYIRNGKKFIVK